MSLKKIWIFIFFTLAVLAYSVVYWNFYKNTDIKREAIIFKNIYPWNDKLNYTIIAFSSNSDISNYTFTSSCDTQSSFLEQFKNIYFFKLEILDSSCSNKNFFLNDWEKILINHWFNLNLIRDFDIYNTFSDYRTNTLLNGKKRLENNIKNLELYSNSIINIRHLDILQRHRKYHENLHTQNILNHIISWRNSKYKIPVIWHPLPTLRHKLPNSPRPYRATYTYWVHEWWDIDTEFWEEVVAIDDWIIIRTVEGFLFSDLQKIKRWDNLTHRDKLENLDILRWNQVWLKTMKWDIIFYWHLDKVYDNIKVWDIITRWTPLWTVWISWVPDKNYTDYHLHFELRQNPYIRWKEWKNDFYDYMNWSWYFEWQPIKNIVNNQYSIFYSEPNYTRKD